MNVSGLSHFASSVAAPTVSRSAPSVAADVSGKDHVGQLSRAEAAELAKLKARDREVREHEQAHLSAAGGLATSGASYTYQRGPDGANYAVGGEVSIDTSAGRTPEDTVQRARTIRAAALAPADPSGQDRAVAARAGQMEQQANAEIARQPADQATTAGTSADTTRRSAIERYYAAASAPQGAPDLSVYA